MPFSLRDALRRILALLLAVQVALLGCGGADSLKPANGVPQYQQPGLVPVPGGFVNAAGGNLVIPRLDLSIDTILGTQEIRATYNSAFGRWLWNFQVTYDGATFVDPTGAAHDVSGIPDGTAIPGTVYVRADATAIETKGGMAFHFSPDAALDHVRWKTQDYPRLAYTTTGLVTEIAQCTAATVCLPFYTIDLNDDGDPLAVTDARTGRVAEFSYDFLGLLATARSALDVEQGRPGFRYEYDFLFTGILLTAVTNSEGERVEYDYQGNRRILEVVQIGEGNPTHRFEFFAKKAGRYPVVHTNPLGAKTRFWFDKSRRLWSVELEDTGETSSFDWAGLRPTSQTLPTGVTTTFSYVGDDLATITQPSGNVIAFSYEPSALNFDDPSAPPIQQIADSVGLVETRSYGPDGRVETVQNGEGDAVAYSYGPATLATFTNAAGAVWSFPFYGQHGHWLQVEGAAEDLRTFDAVGNVLVASVQRQTGGVLTRAWDANRNLASLEVGATDQGSVTSSDFIAIDRRPDGQIAEILRPGGADHEYDYDALGRLVERRERVDGVWQPTTFAYDLAGSLTALELPNGMRTEYTYDGYGRLLRRAALRDGVLEGEILITWLDGRIVASFDSIRNGTEIYAYDTAGRLATVFYPLGESAEIEYDLRSRVAGEVLRWADQSALLDLGYDYDLANRRTRITDRAAALTVLETDFVDGRAATRRFGNGLTRDFIRDPATGELTGATTTDALDAIVETTFVARTGEVGPPRQQIRTTTDTPLASTEEQYWLGLGGTLQPDGRVGKRVFGWNDGAGSAKSFVYDELSNQLSNSDGDLFAYNAEGNRLLSATLVHEGMSVNYAYDEAGYVTSRDGVPITWTATGRMATHGPATFEWDMSGRLVFLSVAGIEREFVLFGGRVASDPQSGAVGAVDLGGVSFDPGTNAWTYRHLDFRSNVSFVSDDAGQIVAHHSYTPYGRDATFGASGDATTFAGRREIGELMILGARIYDPLVGRFLSPDPVFQLVNQFSYTLGNPVWFWDPDGEMSQAQANAAIAAVGFAISTGSLFTLGAGATAAAAVFTAVGFGVAGLALALTIAALFGQSFVVSGPPPISVPSVAGGGQCGLLGIEPFFLVWLLRASRRGRRRKDRKSKYGGRP